MAQLHDTHFHLDLQSNRSSAIREIEQNQIYTIAVTNLPDLYRKESLEIASKFIRFALGFHPELIHDYRKQIPMMWQFLPSVRYVGEVGLDLVDSTYKEEQMTFFKELVEKCRRDRKKILTIHSRRAVAEVLDIIGTDFDFVPILHWYTGCKRDLLKAIDRGYYFSVNSAMMSSKTFLALLPVIPNDRLLLETDSPFAKNSISHSICLSDTVSSLLSLREKLSVSDNFRTILERTK